MYDVSHGSSATTAGRVRLALFFHLQLNPHPRRRWSMSLSNLLHYQSDDDDEPQREVAAHIPDASASITAVPTAVHPFSRSTQPIASIKQLEKRALLDEEHDEEGDGTRKRMRPDAASHTAAAESDRAAKLRASSPAAYVPPPASFFSFAAPTSSSAPVAPTDLLSILPPPKNTRSRNTAIRQSPGLSAVSESGAELGPVVAVSSPPLRPSTPPPVLPSSTPPSPLSSTSIVSPDPVYAPPPGIRKKAASLAQPDSTSADSVPVPGSFTSSALSSFSPAPRIAYSTASPYAVQPSSHWTAAANTVAAAPAAFTSLEEPRMQRQWLEADNIVDVRVDDLTHPPSATDLAAAHQLQSASAMGDIRVKTTFWDARQGKEVSVVGVAGKQQRTHQINSLAIQAKKLESDILRAKEYRAQNRRDTRSKYGW